MTLDLIRGKKNPSPAKKARRAAFQDARRKLAREAAEKRQAEHNVLSTKDKLAKLDWKFGYGLGAVKERARLTAILETEKAEKPTEEKKKNKS